MDVVISCRNRVGILNLELNYLATFISTTLTKRTGATTTVFSPSVVQSGAGNLFAPATYAGLAAALTFRSVRSGGSRRTSVRLVVPQLDTTGTIPLVVSRPSIEVNLYVPDGTLQTDVNDLVGYMNAVTASGLTNANDILVNGIGVF